MHDLLKPTYPKPMVNSVCDAILAYDHALRTSKFAGGGARMSHAVTLRRAVNLMVASRQKLRQREAPKSFSAVRPAPICLDNS
jgi:hypothetical protein